MVQHILFWLFYVVIYTINYTYAPGIRNRNIYETFIFLPGHMVFTYLQMYYTVPRYLLRRKYAQFFIVCLALLIIVLIYDQYISNHVLGWVSDATQPFFYYFIRYCRAAFSHLPIAALAVSIKLYKEWYYQRELTLHAEHEKIKLELDMLRSQLHPHFLFNTLNNLYSLTLSHSSIASTVVLHLSDLLRYILYECAEPEVPLHKEVTMLRKYVELEKLRYGDRLDVAFTVAGDTQQNVIAPLLLLPFVENSFKHSTSIQLDQCWINIQVHIEDNALSFHVTNSRPEQSSAEEQVGGIGMQNVQKRLFLLYPGLHELKIISGDEVYTLKLQVQLKRMGSSDNQPGVHLSDLQPRSI